MATISYTPLTQKALSECIDSEVVILGQVRTIRSGKKQTFIEVGYSDQQLQAVASSAMIAEKVKDLSIQCYCEFSGVIKALPEGKTSAMPFELQVDTIRVISTCPSDFYDQCPPDAGPEIKLEKRHFYFRDPKFALVLRAHAALLKAMRAHFDETDCVEITPPSFASESEGGASLFKLEYPGKTSDKPMIACLTQSSQFALEYVLPGLGDAYCIAPSFRAEKSHTRRHFTEFLHAESEYGGIMTFEDHLQKLRELMQGILKHFLIFAEAILKEMGPEVYDRVVKLEQMTHKIVILEHKDAIKMCHELGIQKTETIEVEEVVDGVPTIVTKHIEVPFEERDDIPEAQERKLIDTIGEIVFLTKFPKEFKSFYMGLDPEDPSRVLGCDIEVPGVGEVVGSGVREYDYQRLYDRMVEQGLKPEEYKAYLDLRKYGHCRTSGMGLGVGRLLTWLLGAYSIRDVTAFPCFPGYYTF
ncbi:MAG: hypothetical protein Terrestrivirus13_4 [Terrestrivirus sp.]|uniref:Asparaginyl-tRNA synthetase n=1 Tax=Terrestrivirus sp. TaxID=2487775 RepID=A0A3G4ZPC2_9VIRU|nr:MAG: hypothetical protein Terrestrivirus13_4 [Terrestrivirus sp.]